MAALPLACLTPAAAFASVMPATTHTHPVARGASSARFSEWQSPSRAFAWGHALGRATVLTLVLFATYLGIGALAHDTHFSLGWVLG